MPADLSIICHVRLATVSQFIVASPTLMPIFLNSSTSWMALALSLIHIFSGSLMGIMAVAAFPQALQQVYSGVLKGAGDTYYIMKYSLVSVAIIRPIITYLLCITLGLGLLGAWLSLCFDQALRLCCSYLRFIKGAWQHKIV